MLILFADDAKELEEEADREIEEEGEHPTGFVAPGNLDSDKPKEKVRATGPMSVR